MTTLSANNISVAIPTWRRPASLRKALNAILACDPPPSEILIHIDAADTESRPMLEREFFGRAEWFQSSATQGPGGGRNLLIERAKQPFVASFDDDSWPLDLDYFATAARLMDANPRAAILTGQVALRGQTPAARGDLLRTVASFEAGACVCRREAFLATRGFMPLRFAYGMEEVDVALQLLDAEWKILRSPALRVFHDSELQHHTDCAVNAAHITNTALLAFLRYPVVLWPIGCAQVLNRGLYAARMRRYRGIFKGLTGIPRVILENTANRKPVRTETVLLSRRLAKNRALNNGTF